MNSNPMYMEYVDDADPESAPRRPGWRVLGWVSIGLSALMVAVSLTAYGFYRQALGNISTQDANALLGPDRPEKLNSALNILLLGSDTRQGQGNAKYGRGMADDPPRSDTIILLHLSPGGEQAMAISFPRDLMVPIPSCKLENGQTTQAQSVGQINASFTLGGAPCTMKTIEGFTNIKIDHFVQVDFAGFKKVTEAVGGVDICLPKAVDDPKSHLKLPAGRHTVKGETALAYVRTRKGLGNGSDTQRIKRQQKFMGALANKALSAGVLSNPSKLYDLLNATTSSLTTDSELTPSVMMKIASGMRGLTSGKLRFVTVPNGQYAPDPNRLALTQPQADRFFTAVRNDKAVPKEPKKQAGPQPKIPAQQVKVRVYNASGIDGQASRVAADLKAQGFQVSVGGNMSRAKTSRVLYGTGADRHAQTLNALIPGAPRPSPRETAGAEPGVVDLVVGTNWTSLKNSKSGGIPAVKDEIKATDDICEQH